MAREAAGVLAHNRCPEWPEGHEGGYFRPLSWTATFASVIRMSDDQHHHDVLARLGPEHRALRQMIPDVYRGFAAISDAALADNALSAKVKELMAMAIGIVHGCDGCIASHAKAAARAGATSQEAAEAIGVSILMHGGPATIYGARAFSAFREFAQDTISR